VARDRIILIDASRGEGTEAKASVTDVVIAANVKRSGRRSNAGGPRNPF
jgi:hypothetical protein